MNFYSDLIKRGESLFRNLINKRDQEHDHSYLEWYKMYREISVSTAWRKVWFSYYKTRLYSLSAASIIVILISLLIFTPSEITIENNIVQILPASDNIVLRTSDGNLVMIDSITPLDTLIRGAVLKGDELVYSDDASELYENSKLSDKRVQDERAIAMNELYVPKGRVFSLVLSDGSRIWLNSESSIKYPAKFGDKQRKVIVTGEVYFDIKSDGRKFIVETPGYSVNVIGTKFNISAYENDQIISTTLVEGSVSIVTDENSEFVISPGEQFTLEKSSKTVSVKQVDVNKYVCWINNELKLDKNSLQDIFKVLQRRYDIDVFFSKENAKLEKYSGDIPLNDNLNVILDQISKVSDIEFQIEGRLVVVRYK
jgi:transmembrane sensor